MISLPTSFVLVLLFKIAHSADDLTTFDQVLEPQSIFSITERNCRVRKASVESLSDFQTFCH
jgi:hypothetical protein